MEGRPYRKVSQKGLQALQQRVQVWNRTSRNTSSTSKRDDTTKQRRTPTIQQNKHEATLSQDVFAYGAFIATKFDEAEQSNDTAYFRACVLSAPHATHLWEKKSGKRYPHFQQYIQTLREQDPELYHEWTTVQALRPPRGTRKSSSRRKAAAKRKSAEHAVKAESRETKTEQMQDVGEAARVSSPKQSTGDKHGHEPTTAMRVQSNKVWEPDPTPPELTTVWTVPRQELPDKPLELHPDLFWSLSNKAVQRWGRQFDTMGTAGCFRLRSTTTKGIKDVWIANAAIPKLQDRTMLIIPSRKSIKATLQRILAGTQRSPETAVLILLPQVLLEQEDVATFVHAYASRGETYRQGALFKEVGAKEYMQLNQAVHEFWIDPAGDRLPHLTERQQRQLEQLLDEFKGQVGDANTSAANRQSEANAHIPYVRLPVKQGHEPGSDPPFKKNPKVRQLTIDFVRDLEARGLVSRCTAEEAVFVCNSLMLPKTNGKHRFVCTFSQLNANMAKDPYGMRTLDAVLTALEGSTWFSVLDVVDGFFNLPLYPADRGYTAFHTPIGVYKWNVLPQGTAASPQIFQRTMDRWFSAYLWKSVIVWMDDILVHSNTFERHLKHLRAVLEVAKKHGLVYNKSKLKLCQRSVKYIGYVFGVGGIRTDPDKVADVHAMPAPKNAKQVRQFLGFAGFYRRFMPPTYADITAPLTELTKKDKPYEWTQICQQAFNKVKMLLTTTPVLVHPDFGLPFHVHCDACGKGVGAMLSQYVDGAYRPIAYCSKRLLPHQVHWAPAQLEAYAIYYAVCVKWRYYLTLNKTIVHTDHRNLSWLFAQSQKGMIGRWHAHLCAYDLDIVYVQGRTQVVADPLSRLLKPATPAPTWTQGGTKQPQLRALTCTLTNEQQERYAYSINGYKASLSTQKKGALQKASSTAPDRSFKFLDAFMGTHNMACNIPRAQWAAAQRQDERLGPIMSYLTRQSTGQLRQTPGWVKVAAQSYRVQQGLLQHRTAREVGQPEDVAGWVLAVPTTLRQRVIRECHSDGMLGHHGLTKTVLAIRQRYHFKNLRASVTKYINTCAACIRAKSSPVHDSVPLTAMFAPDPFNAVAIDLYKPGVTLNNGYRYVLTVVDMCTRWVQFIPLRSKYAAEVMLQLCHHWLAVHGVPQFILSDRGKEFMGVVSTICQAAGITQIRTTPGHPQANGLCEVQHKTLTRELKIRSRRTHKPMWCDLLPEIQFAINVSPDNIVPGISPFQLVFGRKPRLAGKDVTFPSKIVPSPGISLDNMNMVKPMCTRLQQIRLAGLERQLERKQKQRERHDKHRQWSKRIMPQRGDLVHIYHKTAHPKLDYQWSAPVWLVMKRHQNTCKLKHLTSCAGRDGNDVSLKTTNCKNIRITAPRPVDFWIGSRVRRHFSNGWFLGTVARVTTDEGETLFQVEYDDCDQEELDKGQLWDAVIYHPRMCEMATTRGTLPEVHSVILFAHEQNPRFGKVTSVNANSPRPVTVHLWKPNKHRTGLAQARYRASSMNNEPDLMQVTPEQIKVKNLIWDTEGRFTSESQTRVTKYLKKHWIHKAPTQPLSKETQPVKPDIQKVTRRNTGANPNISNQSKTRGSRYNLRSKGRERTTTYQRGLEEDH